jgi:GMP synthase-like glutamine amidotransferase
MCPAGRVDLSAMRMHYLQHVPFESIAAVGAWAAERGHTVTGTLLCRPHELPNPADFDLLVVMGGPMNIYEHEEHPRLPAEKALIRSANDSGKAVLGICLGAQLVADVLGGPVTKGEHVEIGWFPVRLTPGLDERVFGHFPREFPALHYHGDTFAIPPGAVRVASSAACRNQAFAYAGGRVVGLQFHLEVTAESMQELVANAPPPAAAQHERWVQSAAELLSPQAPYAACRSLLFELLDRMLGTVQ